MKKLIYSLLLALPLSTFAQVGIGTSSPAVSAALDVSSTNKGFLPPRISLASDVDVATIASPEIGLTVYNTNASATNLATGLVTFNGTSWVGDVKASNGITANGNAVELGGTLSKNTTIDLNSKNLAISNTPVISATTVGTENILVKDASDNLSQINMAGFVRKASGFVSGTTGISDFVQLDNLQARLGVTNTTRRIELRASGTTFTVSGSSLGQPKSGSIVNKNNQDLPLDATFRAFATTYNFGDHGDTEVINLYDSTNKRMYRITLVIASGFTNSYMSIERLF